MSEDLLSRRKVLKGLSMGLAADVVLRSIPLEAAAYAHEVIDTEKSTQATGYLPKFFTGNQWNLLKALCEAILPADADCGGAVVAGAPEFIDLLTSENPEWQRKLGGGLLWLDGICKDRFDNSFTDCTAAQQKEILDLIAFRKNAEIDPILVPGVAFFALLRNLTADGFFTSKIGIAYLGYQGNEFLLEFPGCPPVPGL